MCTFNWVDELELNIFERKRREELYVQLYEEQEWKVKGLKKTEDATQR